MYTALQKNYKKLLTIAEDVESTILAVFQMGPRIISDLNTTVLANATTTMKGI